MSDASKALGPIRKIVTCAPGATAFDATSGLIASAAMTANLTTPEGGDVDTVPLTAGFNPYSVIKVRSVSTGSVFLAYTG